MVWMPSMFDLQKQLNLQVALWLQHYKNSSISAALHSSWLSFLEENKYKSSMLMIIIFINVNSSWDVYILNIHSHPTNYPPTMPEKKKIIGFCGTKELDILLDELDKLYVYIWICSSDANLIIWCLLVHLIFIYSPDVYLFIWSSSDVFLFI